MALDNVPRAVLESILATSAIITQAAIPSEAQQALQQSLLAVLQVAEVEAANSNAQLAAANCTAQAWQDSCATMQQALNTATDLTAQAQAVAATALQDAAAARDEAAAANIRATLADQATAAATSVLSALLQFTGQLMQLTVLLAAAVLGRFLPVQLLALLPFAKWAELVHLYMCTSEEERQSCSWHLMCCQSTAAALTAMKQGTVGLLQQHLPLMPLQLLCDLYASSPDSTHLLLQAQQRVSMLPRSAQEAWQQAASQCCTIQQVSALISLAGSLTTKPLYTTIGSIDLPLLLEAPARARTPPAPEAAAVAETSLPHQQHAGSILMAPYSSTQHSSFSRPLMISLTRHLLILPVPQPPACSLSAVMACSQPHSNAHWTNAAAVSRNSHYGSQEPPQHAASSADAVVHLTVVHSTAAVGNSNSSSNHSSMTSKATTKAVPNMSTASQGCGTADSTATQPPVASTKSSLHHGTQPSSAAEPTTGAAMCGSHCFTRPTSNNSSSRSVVRGTAESTSDPSSSSHGSHTHFSGLRQLFKQAHSSCFNKNSSGSDQGSINAAGRPGRGQLVCAQDPCQQRSTNASQTGHSSSSGNSSTTFVMNGSGLKLRAAFKGFLHRRHKDSSSSSPSCHDAQCCQPCNTALAGQDNATAADVALVSCPDGNKQSSSSTTTLASTNRSKHVSCAGGGKQNVYRASEDGFSDAAASSDIVMKHVQRHQQQRLRSTAARLRAAWRTDRGSSSSPCADTDQSQALSHMQHNSQG